jgi:hypothetical protein
MMLSILFIFAGYPEEEEPDPDPTYTETTLITDGNNTVPTTTFTAAADGSFVILTITNDSGDDRSGWGIGQVGNPGTMPIFSQLLLKAFLPMQP